jgi:hypothetical protein
MIAAASILNPVDGSRISSVHEYVGTRQIESVFQDRKVEQGSSAVGSIMEVRGSEGHLESYLDGSAAPLAAIV